MGKYTDKVSRGNGPKMQEFMKNTTRCNVGGKDSGGGHAKQDRKVSGGGMVNGGKKPDADG